MSTVTNRWYRTILYWLNNQGMEPERNEYYLMQVASEVRRSTYKPEYWDKVDLNDFALVPAGKKQRYVEEEPEEMTEEEIAHRKQMATIASATGWVGCFGGQVEFRKKSDAD